MLTEAQIQAIKPVRYERKVTDGQGLYLLVTPKGALHWRSRYRFAGKYKTLALGSYCLKPMATSCGRYSRMAKSSQQDSTS